TASLSNSILEYRTYHKAKAWQPNDLQQIESMDIHHHLCTLAQGGDLFLAPIPNDVQKVVDWDSFYKEAFRCTRPGGWLEDYENSIKLDSIDGSLTEDRPMGQWTKVFWEGGKKFGRTFKVVEDDMQIKGMEAAGFVDLVVKEITIPFGPWPNDSSQKEIGLFSKLTMESDVEGYVLYMWAAVMGWSIEEIRVYIAHLWRQIKDPNTHACYRSRVVYGRKPNS
ncbi:hypothetical protein B0H67DRAFT_485762, partial [Lasiosphaeris hirsuta]